MKRATSKKARTAVESFLHTAQKSVARDIDAIPDTDYRALLQSIHTRLSVTVRPYISLLKRIQIYAVAMVPILCVCAIGVGILLYTRSTSAALAALESLISIDIATETLYEFETLVMYY